MPILRVKEILKEKGITGREFSIKIGMTEVGFYKMLSDSGNPPLKRLQEIAEALDLEIYDLFDKQSNNTLHCPNCGAELELKKK